VLCYAKIGEAGSGLFHQSLAPTCENIEGLRGPLTEHRKLLHCQWGPGQIPSHSQFRRFCVFCCVKNAWYDIKIGEIEVFRVNYCEVCG